MKFLIVVDIQNDFISGSLGSAEAVAIVPNVVNKVKAFDGKVIFTRDTHNTNYLSTQEGKKLPVEHCIKGTHGWEICDELLPYVDTVIDKPTFGSVELPVLLSSLGSVDEVTLIGLCTDICVISNAMLIKAAFPEAKVMIDSSCCAGVTPESHNNALSAMSFVQIEIL
jgi:nicotinamidase-related amidase